MSRFLMGLMAGVLVTVAVGYFATGEERLLLKRMTMPAKPPYSTVLIGWEDAISPAASPIPHYPFLEIQRYDPVMSFTKDDFAYICWEDHSPMFVNTSDMPSSRGIVAKLTPAAHDRLIAAMRADEGKIWQTRQYNWSDSLQKVDTRSEYFERTASSEMVEFSFGISDFRYRYFMDSYWYLTGKKNPPLCSDVPGIPSYLLPS